MGEQPKKSFRPCAQSRDTSACLPALSLSTHVRVPQTSRSDAQTARQQITFSSKSSIVTGSTINLGSAEIFQISQSPQQDVTHLTTQPSNLISPVRAHLAVLNATSSKIQIVFKSTPLLTLHCHRSVPLKLKIEEIHNIRLIPDPSISKHLPIPFIITPSPQYLPSTSQTPPTTAPSMSPTTPLPPNPKIPPCSFPIPHQRAFLFLKDPTIHQILACTCTLHNPRPISCLYLSNTIPALAPIVAAGRHECERAWYVEALWG